MLLTSRVREKGKVPVGGAVRRLATYPNLHTHIFALGRQLEMTAGFANMRPCFAATVGARGSGISPLAASMCEIIQKKEPGLRASPHWRTSCVGLNRKGKQGLDFYCKTGGARSPRDEEEINKRNRRQSLVDGCCSLAS